MSEKLIWTKTRPTKPGFYFFKPTQTAAVVVIKIFFNSKLGQLSAYPYAYLEQGEWAGPIPEPIEQEEVSRDEYRS